MTNNRAHERAQARRDSAPRCHTSASPVTVKLHKYQHYIAMNIPKSQIVRNRTNNSRGRIKNDKQPSSRARASPPRFSATVQHVCITRDRETAQISTLHCNEHSQITNCAKSYKQLKGAD